MQATISAKNFNFYYGDFHALKNINLDIESKKVTAFIGPSGCGKSTYCARSTACMICTLACAQKAN